MGTASGGGQETLPLKGSLAQASMDPPTAVPNMTGLVIYSYNDSKERIKASMSAGSSLSNCRSSPLTG